MRHERPQPGETSDLFSCVFFGLSSHLTVANAPFPNITFAKILSKTHTCPVTGKIKALKVMAMDGKVLCWAKELSVRPPDLKIAFTS